MLLYFALIVPSRLKQNSRAEQCCVIGLTIMMMAPKLHEMIPELYLVPDKALRLKIKIRVEYCNQIRIAICSSFRSHWNQISRE